jgi:hypothetical protein
LKSFTEESEDGVAAILINSGRVVFKNPMSPRAHAHEWWAEGGLIHWRDLVTNDNGTLTVIDTLERLRGLNDMVGNSRTGKGASRPDEMMIFRSYIDEMIGVCKLAKEQGMPDDPKHIKQKVQEMKSKRTSRLVLSGLAPDSW